MAGVATGLDRVAEGDADALAQLRGRRLGLLAHPASVDRRLVHAEQVFRAQKLRVDALFGPEHGYGGAAQDMIAVPSAGAAPAQVAVYSLYGEHEQDLVPRPEWLDGLDAVVIDLQDVGSRYYTYVWTAVGTMRVAAGLGIPTVVLDRPNPLGGQVVEGGPQRPGYRSFVGLLDVAVRHGMTLAEICAMARAQDGLDEAALTVIAMRGWTRALDFAQTGLPWVLPSPNMPTLDTARVYPGGCLLEGTNLSEGRGTTRPFEIWGAPFVDGAALASAVSMPGVTLRPLTFQPTFHKHAGQLCGGVQVHLTDPARARAYELYARLLAALRRLAGDALAWRTEPYEFVNDRPAIDLLTGGPEFRLACDGGSIDDWLQVDRAAAREFSERRREWLLYG